MPNSEIEKLAEKYSFNYGGGNRLLTLEDAIAALSEMRGIALKEAAEDCEAYAKAHEDAEWQSIPGVARNIKKAILGRIGSL